MKKTLLKICTCIILAAMLMSVVCITSSAAEEPAAEWDGTTIASGFASGDGSYGNPYVISNPAEWNYFATFVTRNGVSNKCYFILTSDLDFGGHTISPVGTQNNQFKGTFDGRGHTVKNFKMNSETEGDFVALFANVNGSTAHVKNLSVKNATISGNKKMYVATIAAFLTNGKITNVNVDSTVKLELKGDNVSGSTGGIAARNYGTIQYAVSAATINVENSHEKNCNFVGGITGGTGKGTGIVIDCIARGTITTTTANTGGITGILGVTNLGRIENCYNLASVSSTYSVSGLVGKIQTDDGNDIKNCINLSTSITGPAAKAGTIVGQVTNAFTATGAQSVEVQGIGFTGDAGDKDISACDMTVILDDAAMEKVSALEATIADHAAEEAKIVYEESADSSTSDDDGDVSFDDFPDETDDSSNSSIGTKPEVKETSAPEATAETEESEGGCGASLTCLAGLTVTATLACTALTIKKSKKEDQ